MSPILSSLEHDEDNLNFDLQGMLNHPSITLPHTLSVESMYLEMKQDQELRVVHDKAIERSKEATHDGVESQWQKEKETKKLQED